MRVFYFLILAFLSWSPASFAVAEPAGHKLTPAENCPDIRCVRANIDVLDAEMVKVLGQRLTYVKRAGEIKKGKMPVHDAAREKQILERVSQLAEKEGYPGSIAVELYKALLIQTNIYEKKV